MPTYFIGFLFVQRQNDVVYLNGITEDEFFDIMQKYYEDQAAKTILSDKYYIKIPGMLPSDKHYFMFDEIPDNLTFYFESSYAF